MSYRKEREEFVSLASKEGLSLRVIERLLRYASTLQRLAVAQCNGDWPYNGDRDRPSCSCAFIDHAQGDDCQKEKARFDRHYAVCPKCETPGVRKSSMRQSSTIGARVNSQSPFATKICPDCRTQELVCELLAELRGRCRSCLDVPGRDGLGRICQSCQGTGEVKGASGIEAIFGSDPRGAVLRLSTPGFPYDESGRNGARGLYVPARER